MMYQTYLRSIAFLLCSMFSVHALSAQSKQGRYNPNFDKNRRFLKQDAPGADNPAFDDSQWRKLDIPYAWSIKGHTIRITLPAAVAVIRRQA